MPCLQEAQHVSLYPLRLGPEAQLRVDEYEGRLGLDRVDRVIA